MKIKKLLISFVVLLIIGVGAFFSIVLSQDIKTVGYILNVDMENQKIFVISEEGYKKLDGNIPNDPTKLDKEVQKEFRYFHISKFNDLINSKYSPNDKVKIYWNGIIQLEGYFGNAPNVHLIKKID